MSKRSHNKKRNTGLVYEFLIHSISRSLLENNQKKSNIALRILKKHFKPGTQLYKEFRLINSLVKTSVKTSSVASSILQEAKQASKQYNMKQLDKEKSMLIRSINHSLNESDFYSQPVDNYKIYATIQTLMNEWRLRNTGINIEQKAIYEDSLVEWLMSEKKEHQDVELSDESPGTNKILFKIMLEKLNKKYNADLSVPQKNILRTYVWSTANDDVEKIQECLKTVKNDLGCSIESYIVENKENVYVVEQLAKTKNKLMLESCTEVDDNMITRFMVYMQLNDELTKDKSDE